MVEVRYCNAHNPNWLVRPVCFLVSHCVDLLQGRSCIYNIIIYSKPFRHVVYVYVCVGCHAGFTCAARPSAFVRITTAAISFGFSVWRAVIKFTFISSGNGRIVMFNLTQCTCTRNFIFYTCSYLSSAYYSENLLFISWILALMMNSWQNGFRLLVMHSTKETFKNIETTDDKK